MGKNTDIEWADATFNPWFGCTKVAPECANCYAKTKMDDRLHKVQWGPNGTRVLTGEENWRGPYKWNREAAKAGVKLRVFCASLADVFEDNREVVGKGALAGHDLNYARQSLFNMVMDTPSLIWLLLTKRPENIRDMVPAAWLEKWPANVWTGTSAGCQATADAAIPHLLSVPGPHFLSCEPMLGPVDLTRIPISVTDETETESEIWSHNVLSGNVSNPDDPKDAISVHGKIDWVICGGESGPKARPMHPAWALVLRDQCQQAGTPFLFKQWGEWTTKDAVVAGGNLRADCDADRVRIIHPTGQSDLEVFESTQGRSTVPGSCYMRNVGKKTAGRILDGRTWDELPAAFINGLTAGEVKP